METPVILESSEVDVEISDNSQTVDSRLVQPTAISLPPQHPPPMLVMATTHTPSEQYNATTPGDSNTSPLPTVITVVFDGEQQLDDQDKVMVEPKHKQPSGAIAEKIALLPKLNLKRVQSATEALNSMHTTASEDIESHFTSSTEYPYVLHAFEVVGKKPAHVGSLPNMHQFTKSKPSAQPRSKLAQNQVMTHSNTIISHTPRTNFNTDSLCDSGSSNKLYNQNGAIYANIESEDANLDSDDEPSYSYADRRGVVQNTADSLSTNGNKQHSSDTSNLEDNQYGDYPSSWTPEAQPALTFGKVPNDCQSPEYQEVDDAFPETLVKVRSESAALSFSQVPPSKDPIAKQKSVPLPKPKTKPAVQPRSKLTQKQVMSSGNITQPSVSTHAVERSHQQQRKEMCINLAQPTPENQNDVDTSGENASLSAQTPNKYMKLQSTNDDFHPYMSLLNRPMELSDITISDTEMAHPKEWCQ